MKTIFLVLYIVITIWALSSVILHGSRPTKSISWVLAILALPFAGPLLYYLFGVNRRKFKLFKLKETEKRKLYDSRVQDLNNQNQFQEAFDSKKKQKIAQLIESNCLLSAYSGNKVVLLNSGKDTFDSLYEAIARAKTFIHLQYFIIEDGQVLDQLYTLFKEKVEQGVEVRMTFDAIGSFSLPRKSIKRIREIGVKISATMPLRYGNILFNLNYRNHRKLVIIDGNVGFTGGVNLSDKYLVSDDDLGIWNDFHLKLEGPVVNSLHRIFIKDYHFSGNEELLLQKKYLPDFTQAGESTIQIVTGGPDSKHPAIMQQYVAMINAAEKSIYIANPYFIPGTTVLEALKIAAMSGVEVHILVPKKSDSILARLSMYSNFEGMLRAGVHIYLRPDFSHSKVVVIDSEIASVGSGNFDHRSFEHNFETNALLYDNDLSNIIVSKFKVRCQKAVKVEFEIFKQRPLVQKFAEGLARFFSPLL